jgi:hypothetical protein
MSPQRIAWRMVCISLRLLFASFIVACFVKKQAL